MKIETIKKYEIKLSQEDVNAMNVVTDIFGTCIKHEIEIEDEYGLTISIEELEEVLEIMDRFYSGVSLENLG